MDWLNYQHLYYFWCVARTGSVRKASDELRLSPPTVSAQIRALSDAIGEELFARSGRTLILTEAGHTVYHYAEDIFSLGRELLDTVKDRPTGQPLRVSIGIADAVPKLVAYRLIEPVFHLPERVRIQCREGSVDRLLGDLAIHELDVVLADAPVSPGLSVQAFNHPLGEAGVVFMAMPRLARQYKRKFPQSLDGAPMLLPSEQSGARRNLEQWFDTHEVRPRIVGEFDDYALLRIFGEAGHGIIPVPSILEPEMRKRGLSYVGRADTLYGRFYAISPQRKLQHPAVNAICSAARKGFAAPPR